MITCSILTIMESIRENLPETPDANTVNPIYIRERLAVSCDNIGDESENIPDDLREYI